MKMINNIFRFSSFLFFTIWSSTAIAQNTVGLLSYDENLSIDGYNLIFPERQPDVFLLNECGEIVHQWEDDNELARPGSVAYFLANGNMIKAKSETGAFSTGGGGGIVEMVSWDNELLWRYEITMQHHDIHVMPNGHVLMLIWKLYDLLDIVEMGFDTINNIQDQLVFETIIEVDPETSNIVWQWNSTDHLVQEVDVTKDNYGQVSQHPERIDINYQEFSFDRPDFMHANSIDYNEALDQVMISVRNYNEIWIIDHSTTTAEAATSVGGNSGRGGDLLYRWGNIAAYKQGTIVDKKNTRQHDAQWIDDFVNPTYPYFGAIALFNNGVAIDNSYGQILTPTWDAATQTYLMTNSTFLPTDFSETFSHPDTSKNHSTSASSIQIMGDGQIIMCAARQGFAFELTTAGEVAWEYRVPLRNGYPVTQGTTLALSENFTFQLQRYPNDYPAFDGRDLSPKGFIEFDPNTDFCTLVNTNEVNLAESKLDIFPNPSSDFLFIKNKKDRAVTIEIYNLLGMKIYENKIGKDTAIDISTWERGLYFIVNIENNNTQKIIIEH